MNMKKIITIALLLVASLSYYSSIELGLIYSLMVVGVFISYRILDVPDLTVDGSFTLGAAVSALYCLSDRTILGLAIGMICGGGAGVVSALLQTKLKIQPILAGILTMMGLYSINLMIMGGAANISMLGAQTLFNTVDHYKIVLIIGVGIVIIGIASVIIGEVCWNTSNLLDHIIAMVIGSIVYRIIIAIAFDLNFLASSMKLVSAVIVISAVGYPVIREKLELNKRRRAHYARTNRSK